MNPLPLTENFQHVYPSIKARYKVEDGSPIMEFKIFKKPWFLGFIRKRRWVRTQLVMPPVSEYPINIIINKKMITVLVNSDLTNE